MRVVAAPDKFRGTATAAQVASAIGAAAWEAGWDCDERPMADGGEGTMLALGGPNRTSTVTGPLGSPVEARWRLDGRTAVIEMAEAAGLWIALEQGGNDPVAATTRGVGELIRIAVESGATRVIVGVGGSATTDGGLGAIEALHHARLRAVELVVACDVRTTFLDAAPVFAPQKGASPAQVRLLANRLQRLADVYRLDHGVDVTTLTGAGAAGGLAGGLAALGARLVEGASLVADEIGLDHAIDGADLVITGEGYLDAESFHGKVVGEVLTHGQATGVPVAAIVGDCDPPDELPRHELREVVSLVALVGEDAARQATLRSVHTAAHRLLAELEAAPH